MQELKGSFENQNGEPKADLVEIFSSFQGEGLFVGAKQIFIRFAGCNLNCSFCDTQKDAVIKDAAVDEVLKEVMELEKTEGRHHAVSLTGGEPLLHVDFLEFLLPKLKEKNFKTYLETNGTLSEELRRVIDYVDIVSMDIKLPSAANMSPLWEKHIEFLKIAREKDVFVKVVVTDDTLEGDIIEARNIVGKFNHNMPFILQPASMDEKGTFKIATKRLLSYLNLSEERLRNVRVIPQVHKFMSIK